MFHPVAASPMRPCGAVRAAWIPAITLLAASLSTACRGTDAAGRVSRSGEASVNPGINQSYEAEPDVETWIRRFESESREIFQQRHRIIATLALVPGMTVADIGAGTGFLTEILAGVVGPDGRVYAVDIKPEFVAHIRQRLDDEGVGNVTTVLCAADSVELDPQSIDLAFTSDTYHHFEFPISTLRSIYRALRPGGHLVVVDFERIEGQSRPWVLDHVRAGKDTVISEIELVGFEFIEEVPSDFLKENYILRFRRPA